MVGSGEEEGSRGPRFILPTSVNRSAVVRHADKVMDWRDMTQVQRYTPRSPNRLEIHE